MGSFIESLMNRIFYVSLYDMLIDEFAQAGIILTQVQVGELMYAIDSMRDEKKWDIRELYNSKTETEERYISRKDVMSLIASMGRYIKAYKGKKNASSLSAKLEELELGGDAINQDKIISSTDISVEDFKVYGWDESKMKEVIKVIPDDLEEEEEDDDDIL